MRKRRVMLKSFVLYLLLTTVFAGLAAQGATDASVPLESVTLYSAGLAYFEYQGQVSGDAALQLQFSPDQIKDVLKSLILIDQDGGTIDVVNYASQDPVSKSLESFRVNLSENPSMEQILRQMRGAEVLIKVPQEIKGRILSLETQLISADTSQTPRYQTRLNLLSDQGLRSIPLESIDSLEPVDAKLKADLNQALELIFSAAESERKNLEIHFNGEGKRRVKIAYINEAPVWKSSYRIDLSSKYLQGWALVENTSDKDWKQVRLSLSNANPLAFIQDLYTPLYNPRPVLEAQLQANLKPQAYDKGMSYADEEVYAESEADYAFAPSMSAPVAKKEQALNRSSLLALDAGGIQAAARDLVVGEQFFFTLAHPVDLPRHSGAMIPLISENLELEPVSVYNPAVLGSNPLKGARLKNTGARRLPAGPLSVYDQGVYAGDALLSSLGAGESALFTYAIDQDVQVQREAESSQTVQKFYLNKGLLYIQRSTIWDQQYSFRSNSKTALNLLLEQSKTPGRSLKGDLKPLETTETVYRFALTLKPQETKRFTVSEEQVQTESVALVSANTNYIISYLSNAKLQAPLKAAIQKALTLREAVDQSKLRLNALKQDQAAEEKNQARYRANLEAVGKDNPQGKFYLEKLMDSEKKLDGLALDLRKEEQLQQTYQQDLQAYLKDLSFE